MRRIFDEETPVFISKEDVMLEIVSCENGPLGWSCDVSEFLLWVCDKINLF